MNKYGVNELRKMYLDFFEGKGHLCMTGASLVPQNDNSLLLINAGMAPFKAYFTGRETPPRKRMASCQKCVRTGDIENVGKTARHLTFFEMLGNFSFGDYFKREAIAWSWEFLTKVIGMEEDRLYPSIYYEDDEAFRIWNEEIGIPADKIKRFYRDADGKCDNFWEHGAGPCGPCSEIYYDRGEDRGCRKPDCGVGCDCDRFIEVWNNVFTQYEGDGKGNYTELENKNIDTGMGLERLAVVVQDVESVFDIDTMKAIRDGICSIAGIEYGSDDKKDISVRLITDHIRSSTFLISDGVMPSNEGRGYVLRRLIRRAARHGRLLGIQTGFLAQLSEIVIRESKEGYPELEEKKHMIFTTLTQEENQFGRTVDQGLGILADMQEDMIKEGRNVLSGDDAFKLYDTYGFPIDLTAEILGEKGFSIDMDVFNSCMDAQRKMAKAARKTTNYMGADETVYESLPADITSSFVGYDKLSNESSVTAITTEDAIVSELCEGDTGTIIVKETVFYAAMGGQEADTGTITAGDSIFEVYDVIKLRGGKIGHVGKVVRGSFHISDKVTLSIDMEKRNLTCKNHSATHLLQKSLRLVLGEHVEQKGSSVGSERLRFDFTHFGAMSYKEIRRVEEMVNSVIADDVPVVTREMNIDDAKKTGAMALFGEKYGETVRVVSMGDFSIELCGGTHVSGTGRIGSFKILSESGISTGVRRIEALTSKGVIKYFEKIENELMEAARTAKSEPFALTKKIGVMQEEIKKLAGENEKLRSRIANETASRAADMAVDISGIKMLTLKVSDADVAGLRNLGDNLREKSGSKSLVIIASTDSAGKVTILATAAEEAVQMGIHAGKIIKEIAGIIGGGGGGKPNMAQAGGNDPSGIERAFEAAKNVAERQVAEKVRR